MIWTWEARRRQKLEREHVAVRTGRTKVKRVKREDAEKGEEAQKRRSKTLKQEAMSWIKRSLDG
jgi:hypothetical protein